MKMNLSIVPTLRLLSITLLAGLALVSCKKSTDELIDEEAGDNIMVIAKADPELSTFVSALTKAQLVTTLEHGKYTVLAPTNAAFSSSSIDINALSSDSLRAILLPHIVVSEYKIENLDSSSHVTAINRPVYFSSVDAVLYVNGGSKIVSGDLEASNGILHKVDHLISTSQHNIVQYIRYTPEFSTLYSLLKRPALRTLTDSIAKGTYTLLAPTNEAFRNFKDTLSSDYPRNIIAGHVISNRVFTSNFKSNTVNTLWRNHPINVSRDASGIITLYAGADSTATKAKILTTGSNVSTTNGVVHRIDAVIK
ncbi:hypothetical protein BWI96_06725 [Siphonobacter sp. SORGH_AS_0500]|uniref:fasciclin domain-containing protein n=1 Tax=Siphonobacter sp. SORGH_AS_0500 TaxID=1864824 RepID=UPI000CBBEB99|nr:fasciclin domain-containing protein [Siphonobacter sp. SORGH_AS_0500]PKK37549.1 hypothetical protein BWI96_06725 [Siphonobacter sp. SORGH_AS_0500]